MELKKLEGNIIGIVDFKKSLIKSNKMVNEIIIKKIDDSLKIVKLDNDIKNKKFNDLSIQEKKKVILASKLHDDIIVLDNFFLYFNQKDKDYFKRLFKKIQKYNKKIIIIEPNFDNLINLVDTIYIKTDKVEKYNDFYNTKLYQNSDKPIIIEFINKVKKKGIEIDNYTDIDELIKAIYRSISW